MLTQPRVCVIGGGSSGLAAVREFVQRRFEVVCYERGSQIGGNWRYENDNGLSAAYASLRTNVSRARMKYPSLPLPRAYRDYVHHSDMLAYLEAYASAFGLSRHIRFQTTVERAAPDASGWVMGLDDGTNARFDAVVVATGHDWALVWPAWIDAWPGERLHAHDYRVPSPLAGRRVLVAGAGQSAAEIATEAAQVGADVYMSWRSGRHVVPRHVLGHPVDFADRPSVNRLPWKLLRVAFAAVERLRAPMPGAPPPGHRLMEHMPPIVSSDFAPLMRAGAIKIKAEVVSVEDDAVRFVDDTTFKPEIVACATGYRIALPFLDRSLTHASQRLLPLYRRIAAPDAPGLYFVGFVDPVGG